MKGKIPQAAVAYMPAKMIGSAKGAHCGDCVMMNAANECAFLYFRGRTGMRHAVVSPARGVCDLYVYGQGEPGLPLKPQMLIPGEAVGYIEDGPTHCGSCRFFVAKDSDCTEVENDDPYSIQSQGCCNLWRKEKFSS